jgi:N utilization substance protein B
VNSTTPDKTGKPHKIPGKPISPRHRAREFVVQGIYQYLVGGQDIAAIIVQAESAGGFDKVNRELYDALLDGVLKDPASL